MPTVPAKPVGTPCAGDAYVTFTAGLKLNKTAHGKNYIDRETPRNKHSDCHDRFKSVP